MRKSANPMSTLMFGCKLLKRIKNLISIKIVKGRDDRGDEARCSSDLVR